MNAQTRTHQYKSARNAEKPRILFEEAGESQSLFGIIFPGPAKVDRTASPAPTFGNTPTRIESDDKSPAEIQPWNAQYVGTKA
ncbi:MAG: hypothetical protein Q8J72_04280 [Rhodocyclaceae bacterium]|nr:hypothetical protein [Rhodocyclaceae bacterium]